MILSTLCAVVGGYILGFLTGVAVAKKTNEYSVECGYISIGDTTYKLVPMDKRPHNNPHKPNIAPIHRYYGKRV